MLRRFTEADYAPAVDLFYDLFTNPPWLYDWMTKEMILSYFRDILRVPGTIAYVYLLNGDLCGVCLGSASDCAPVAVYEIKEIFVRRDQQGQGVGRAMLAAIETDLKAQGVAAVRLYTMRGIPAFEFYMKQGYQEVTGAVALSKILE